MERTYISAGVEYNGREKHVNAPIFKRTFDWEHGKKAARLEISVAGFYRLFLNGQELTKGYLAPYISNPDQMLFYDEYEVGERLKEKNNELYVLLGNGFSNCIDCGVWDFEKASYRAAPKLYLGLYAGETRVLTTDENFRVTDSPLTFDDLRAGERYDARLEKELFTAWKTPVSVAAPKGKYVKCEAQPILEAGRLRPVAIKRTPRGYVYDFGENNAGTFRLNVRGKEGQKLIFTLFEVPNAEGDPDLRNLTFEGRVKTEYFQRVEYVCKEGEQAYTPSFSYFGYRYILVEGLTEEQANEELLAFVVLHSAIEKRGSFSCSDRIVNRIQECVERSDLSNFFYYPTDCPQREKNGWTGDICVSAEQYGYNFYAYPSFRQWLSCVRAAQLPSGEIPGIVPTGGWGYAWGNGVAWDDVLNELPLQLYRFTGKREILEENIQAILRYCDYMLSKRTDEGLLDYGLGDWCEAGMLNEATRTPVEITSTLIGVGILERTAFICDELERNEEAARVRREVEALRTAFRRKYVTGERVTVDTQTAQILALYAGIFEENYQTAYEELKRRIQADGTKLRVGILGIKRLFKILSDNGDAALALKLIVGPQFPSYGYLIEQGATTLWEIFERLEWKDGLLQRQNGVAGLGSFNHHFFGSVSAWFYQALAGLQVVSYGKLKIDPAYECGLDFAEATYHDDRASVRVKWEKQGSRYALTVENDGFNGVVIAPDGKEYPLENGTKIY